MHTSAKHDAVNVGVRTGSGEDHWNDTTLFIDHVVYHACTIETVTVFANVRTVGSAPRWIQ